MKETKKGEKRKKKERKKNDGMKYRKNMKMDKKKKILKILGKMFNEEKLMRSGIREDKITWWNENNKKIKIIVWSKKKAMQQKNEKIVKEKN